MQSPLDASSYSEMPSRVSGIADSIRMRGSAFFNSTGVSFNEKENEKNKKSVAREGVTLTSLPLINRIRSIYAVHHQHSNKYQNILFPELSLNYLEGAVICGVLYERRVLRYWGLHVLTSFFLADYLHTPPNI